MSIFNRRECQNSCSLPQKVQENEALTLKCLQLISLESGYTNFKQVCRIFIFKEMFKLQQSSHKIGLILLILTFSKYCSNCSFEITFNVSVTFFGMVTHRSPLRTSSVISSHRMFFEVKFAAKDKLASWLRLYSILRYNI